MNEVEEMLEHVEEQRDALTQREKDVLDGLRGSFDEYGDLVDQDLQDLEDLHQLYL